MRSFLLTDKLLKLFSLISLGQPDVLKRLDDSARQEESTEGRLLVDKAVKEDQLQLAVEVLTSKACREEGLVPQLFYFVAKLSIGIVALSFQKYN